MVSGLITRSMWYQIRHWYIRGEAYDHVEETILRLLDTKDMYTKAKDLCCGLSENCSHRIYLSARSLVGGKIRKYGHVGGVSLGWIWIFQKPSYSQLSICLALVFQDTSSQLLLQHHPCLAAAMLPVIVMDSHSGTVDPN